MARTIARNRKEENSQRSTPINREQEPNAQRSIQPDFENALDDDLNISAALGFLFESIRETNRAMDENKLNAPSANAWLNWWNRINTVLDLEPETEMTVPAEVAQLAKERENARREKTGSEATTCAIKFPPWVGKCVIRRKGKNSQHMARRDLGISARNSVIDSSS